MKYLVLILLASLSAEAKKALHAHHHGAAELTVAVEGKEVEVEFKSPNSDILGFEKAPTSELEKNSVQQMKAQLEKDFEPIVFPADAGCKLMSRKVEFDFPDTTTDHDHSDMEMEVKYTCLALDKVKALETVIFKRFQTLSKVKVSVVNGTYQASETLTPKKVTFKLKP